MTKEQVAFKIAYKYQYWMDDEEVSDSGVKKKSKEAVDSKEQALVAMSMAMTKQEAVQFGMGLIVGEKRGYADNKRNVCYMTGSPGYKLAALMFEAAKSLPEK